MTTHGDRHRPVPSTPTTTSTPTITIKQPSRMGRALPVLAAGTRCAPGPKPHSVLGCNRTYEFGWSVLGSCSSAGSVRLHRLAVIDIPNNTGYDT